MQAKITFKTRGKNHYLFSPKSDRLLLVHPVVHLFVNLENQGIDLGEWIKDFKGKAIETRGCVRVSKKRILFYYQKYLLLKENGFFSKPDIKKKISWRLNADNVKFQMANIDNVLFEVTDACNLECEYCGYGKFYDNYDRRENKDLSVGVGKKVIDYLREFWQSPLNISHEQRINIGFYGGEPLLNMEFIKEMAAYVGEVIGPANLLMFSMTTNGLLLQKHMDFLVENDFVLLVSLDGDEENNRYRVYANGKPAFKDIYENVMALKQAYPDYFDKRVNFNAVLHNRNSVAEIHRFFKEHFGKVPMISEVNPHGITSASKEDFMRTYRNIRESLNQAEDYALIERDMFFRLPDGRGISEFIHQYSGYVCKDYKQLLHGKRDMVYTPTGTCLPFSRKLFVTVNGKILPCERIGHQYALGHVDEKRVRLDFQEIADRYNEYYDKVRDQCHDCYNTQSCQQCLFYLDIEKQNPECKGFMNADEFEKYLSACMSYLEKHPGVYARVMKEVVIE